MEEKEGKKGTEIEAQDKEGGRESKREREELDDGEQDFMMVKKVRRAGEGGHTRRSLMERRSVGESQEQPRQAIEA